jgi:4-hydroxythreonine-4-phosphate dehydrogenase
MNNLLALTMGDPAGIAPEISRKAWEALRHSPLRFVLLADPRFYHGRVVGSLREAVEVFPEALPILPVPLAVEPHPSEPDPANAAAVIASIEQAVALARSGQAGGVVTNPISKTLLYAAGFRHPGHTEFLGELCGGAATVMMLVSPQLRVVPVTIHVGLRAAIESLTTEKIVATCRITAQALRRNFGVAQPRLAMAGLNPHAGENGAMGDEETRIIQPAVEILRAEGIDVTDPLPPDTMFTPSARARYDVAIGMYHDQVLIPIKTLDRDNGVNVTLGLPIIRTSPDHGTAFDIAGCNVSDPSSLIAALRLAHTLATQRT